MTNALWFLLETVGSLLSTACILRAYMHWLGMSTRDPIGQFLIAITDWIVKPLQRVVPAIRNYDWASILAALVLATVLAIAYLMLGGFTKVPVFGAVVLMGIFWLIKWTLFLLMVVVFAQVVLSWVNPQAPVAPTMNSLTRPFLAPIRRIVPLIGGMDLSPMVLLIGVMFLSQFVQGTLGAYLHIR